MIAITSLAGASSPVDHHLGYGDSLETTRERVGQSAEAAGDHPWIRVDVDRAAPGPFGGTIGHGYLTLSTLSPGPMLLDGLAVGKNLRTGVDYGPDQGRFPSPVPVSSRRRLGATLLEAVDRGGGGVQARREPVFETEDSTKPACVAELLLRYEFEG